MSWPKAILFALLLFGAVCIPVAYVSIQTAVGPSQPASGTRGPLTVVSSPSGSQAIQTGVYTFPASGCASIVSHYGLMYRSDGLIVIYQSQSSCVGPQPAVTWLG